MFVGTRFCFVRVVRRWNSFPATPSPRPLPPVSRGWGSGWGGACRGARGGRGGALRRGGPLVRSVSEMAIGPVEFSLWFGFDRSVSSDLWFVSIERWGRKAGHTAAARRGGEVGSAKFQSQSQIHLTIPPPRMHVAHHPHAYPPPPPPQIFVGANQKSRTETKNTTNQNQTQEQTPRTQQTKTATKTKNKHHHHTKTIKIH